MCTIIFGRGPLPRLSRVSTENRRTVRELLSHLWDLDFDDSGCCAVLFIFELPDLFGLDLDVLGVEGRRLRVLLRALQTFKVDFSDADAGIRTRVVLGGGLEVASEASPVGWRPLLWREPVRPRPRGGRSYLSFFWKS